MIVGEEMAFAKSKKHRKQILDSLTAEQREVILKHYKFKKKNDLFNSLYDVSDQWELLDVKMNENYGNCEEDEKLYCECGKELKYQYVLFSKKENKEVCLGINHFKTHTNIPVSVANRVKRDAFKIDFWLDDILVQIEFCQINEEAKETNEKILKFCRSISLDEMKEYNNKIHHPLSKNELNLMVDFVNADLVLPPNISDAIEEIEEYRLLEIERDRRYKAMLVKKEKEEKSKEQKKINALLIAECRVYIVKELKKADSLTLEKLYIENKGYIDKLLKIMDAESLVKAIFTSVNKYSAYKVNCQNNVIHKVGEKTI